MPTRTDTIQKIRIDEQNPALNLNTWLKGSDPALGSPWIEVPNVVPRYPAPWANFYPLLSSDPASKLEPAPTAATAETTRFTRYILLYATPITRTFIIHLLLDYEVHRYVDTLTGTYYYKYYGKLVKTTDFSTFTDVTTEVNFANISHSEYGTAGWYDGYAGNFRITNLVTLNAGEFLLLSIRGTSYSTIGNNSIGLYSTKAAIRALLFI